jgi:hypothetical protein
LYKEICNDLETAVLNQVHELFGEIYSDEPAWQEAMADPEVRNDPHLEDRRAQLLQVAHAWACLRDATESLRQGTSQLIRAWFGREDIVPLIQEFKYLAERSPELRLFSKIDQMREIGALHSRYDAVPEIETGNDPDA